MDEATSELDTETEATIQATLEEMRGKMTMLIVAHRLSTITSADLGLCAQSDAGGLRETLCGSPPT